MLCWSMEASWTGSGWEGVYKILAEEGYNVTVVQNPTISLADDVAVTKRAIDAQDGPVILVGHSYGGVVISSAGDDPKVVGLVYICAFAADTGDQLLVEARAAECSRGESQRHSGKQYVLHVCLVAE